MLLKNRLLDLKNKLVNIDKRNTSLLLRRSFVKTHFDLAKLAVLEKRLPEKVVSSLLQSKGIVPVKSSHRGPQAENLRHLITTLRNESDFIEAENGSYEVCLGWPFVEGTFSNGDYFRCPLLLIPVRLKTDLGRQAIEIEPDEHRAVRLNRTFLLAVQKNDGMKATQEDASELDAVPGLDGLMASSPEHVIKQVLDLYANHKIAFEKGEPTAEVVEMLNAPPSKDPKRRYPFRVLPHAVIGQFSQAATSILADFDELLKEPPSAGKLAELVGGEKPAAKMELQEQELEKDRFYVCETDHSQEKTIEASRSGRDVLIQGPPGTGKSQVIANLVADNLARGKRVLIVCEKRAALDVVYRRLHKAGLSQFLQLVHDPGVDRDAVYDKTRHMLEHYALSKPEQVERELQAASDEITEAAGQLNGYATQLHAKTDCGYSLFELYRLAAANARTQLDLTSIAPTFTGANFSAFKAKAALLLPLEQKYAGPNNPGRHRKLFSKLDKQQVDALIEQSSELIHASDALAQLAKGLGLQPGHKALEALERKHKALSSFKSRGLLGGIMAAISGRDSTLLEIARTHGEDSKETVNELKRLLERGGEHLPQSTLKSARAMHELFLTVEAAATCSAALEKLRKFYDAKLIDGWQAQVRGLALPLADIERLPHKQKSVDEIQALERKLAECSVGERQLLSIALSKMPGAPSDDVVAAIGKSLAQDWIAIAEQKMSAVRELDNKAYLQARRSLASAIERKAKLVPRHIAKEWTERIAEPVLFDWGAASKGDASSLVGWLRERHRGWLEWQRAKANNETLGEITLTDGYHDVTVVSNPVNGGIQLTYSSFVYTPDNSSSHKREYEDFVPCTIAREGDTLIVRAKGPEYSGIVHEVSKKRMRWTLRKFVSEFGSRGLFELFPVWLCSPETVSAILPLKQGFFDCVIFDEASQCPVEKAAPSIHRAKTVVVAGDDKQLPPFDMFRRYYFEEGGDGLEEEYDEGDEIVKSESLLHGSARYQYNPLMWHYRSKHESLIRFSNAAFYHNRLQTMPNSQKDTNAFEWVSVAGTWEKRRNHAEAEKVVELVTQLLEKPVHPSIGIITFNSEQRDLIQSKLDAKARYDSDFAIKYEREKARKENEELLNIFVKNIENVQGDERDYIIFSIAYAPGVEGDLRHQFGSLSAQGGENRLNVAISRAKEKVIIVASIEPTQLKVDAVANDGPKLLKKYLQYARAVAGGDRRRADEIIDALSPRQALSPQAEVGSAFEADVARELEKLGYKIEMRVGASKYGVDLAIIDPKNSGRYALGIELDGESYFGAPSANERDVYRPRFLKNLGWSMHRISSRDWWLDRQGVLKEIREKIKAGSPKTVENIAADPAASSITP
jgi:very-short-patch-repair endonuclease